MVGLVVGMKEDQCILGLRRTILSDDFSCFGIGIVGSKARLALYNTYLGETGGRGPFDCADWVRPLGEDHMVMIKWVKPVGT